MAKTKEEKAAEKAVKLAEKTEIKQLEAAQKAEVTALKAALKQEGLRTSEINRILSTEKKANSTELKTAKTTLQPTGRQSITQPGAPILSQASVAYANLPAAQQVSSTLNNAVNAYNQYGLQQQQVIRGDGAYSGVSLNDMAKLVLNRDANGNIVQTSDVARVPSTLFNLANLAKENLGKTFTTDQIGKLKEVGTDANGNKLFRDGLTNSPTRNSGAIYAQQPDGTYKNVGYSMTTLPEQKEGFFQSDLGKLALVGATLAGGWALAPAGLGGAATIGSALGTSTAVGGAVGGAALGGTTAALSGGDVLTGAALGGVGGFAAGGGFTGFGDTLTKTFSDITGLDTGTVKNFFTAASQPADAASFAADDALNLASRGFSVPTIQQNLIASGVDPLTAATLANNAVMPGATASTLAASIANQPVYNNVAGVLSGGDAFATTDSVFKQLVANGMSPADAAQVINTSGGGLGLPSVSVDSAGNLVQNAAGAAAGAGVLSQLGDKATEAAKNVLGGGGGGGGNRGLGGLLGGLAGMGGAMLDRAALERYAAELQKAAAEQAPRMQFQPIGITTRFGSTTTPQYDEQGRLIGFGYTPAADIAAQRDRLLSLSSEALPTTTNLQQATTNYLRDLEALQRPTDEQTLAGIQARLQATGRTGLGVGATSGAGGSLALAATNPELAAYYNAVAQRQARQALEAEDVAQRRLSNQLTTSGNLLTQARTLEEAAQQPLRLGTDLGQMTTAGSTNAANAELRAAQLGAALKAEGAQGVNKALTLGGVGLAPSVGNILGNAFPSLGGLFGGGTQNTQNQTNMFGGTTQATNDWLSGLNII